MKYYFINPNSGKRQLGDLESKIHQACIKRKIPYEILYTKAPGDGKRLAKKISDSEECTVFSVGGDGNLNDVLNGVIDSENKILGNIPYGSGNDYDRTLKNYEDQYVLSDVGVINGRYFINVACLGLDADVANNLEKTKNKKWIPVSQRYNASLVYTFTKFKPKKLALQIGDFQTETEITIIALGNGQFYGGGYRIAPKALVDDGALDIYIVEKMPKTRILGLLLKLMHGTHETSPKVKKYRNECMIVDSEELCAFNVDGEKLQGRHFEISLKKNAVKVFNDRTFIDEITGDK